MSTGEPRTGGSRGQRAGAEERGGQTPTWSRCGYCHRMIHKQRNGAWYHDRNSSVACDPGSGDGRKAFPT